MNDRSKFEPKHKHFLNPRCRKRNWIFCRVLLFTVSVCTLCRSTSLLAKNIYRVYKASLFNYEKPPSIGDHGFSLLESGHACLYIYAC